MLTIKNFYKIRHTDMLRARAHVVGVEEGGMTYNFTIETVGRATYDVVSVSRISLMDTHTGTLLVTKNGIKCERINPSELKTIVSTLQLLERVITNY